MFLSVITIGEIAHGVARLVDGRRKQELAEWLSRTSTSFVDRVLPIDITAATRWGELAAKRMELGKPIGAPDGLIAATALVHGLTIVTRNVDDFDQTGADVFNPW